MYTDTNYKRKKHLIAAVKAGNVVTVFQPGPFGPHVADGTGVVEGPQFPAAHQWYAAVIVKDGVIVSAK